MPEETPNKGNDAYRAGETMAKQLLGRLKESLDAENDTDFVDTSKKFFEELKSKIAKTPDQKLAALKERTEADVKWYKEMYEDAITKWGNKTKELFDVREHVATVQEYFDDRVHHDVSNVAAGVGFASMAKAIKEKGMLGAVSDLVSYRFEWGKSKLAFLATAPWMESVRKIPGIGGMVEFAFSIAGVSKHWIELATALKVQGIESIDVESGVRLSDIMKLDPRFSDDKQSMKTFLKLADIAKGKVGRATTITTSQLLACVKELQENKDDAPDRPAAPKAPSVPGLEPKESLKRSIAVLDSSGASHSLAFDGKTITLDGGAVWEFQDRGGGGSSEARVVGIDQNGNNLEIEWQFGDPPTGVRKKKFKSDELKAHLDAMQKKGASAFQFLAPASDTESQNGLWLVPKNSAPSEEIVLAAT